MMTERGATTADLFERFPALARLGALRHRQVPFVQQLSDFECGAACLAMVLSYFGKELSIDQLRETTDVVGRDGLTAVALLEAARHQGLRSRGVRVAVDELELLPQASILHWDFRHFVVFDRLRKGGVDILDPAYGRRHVSMSEVQQSFTGVALTFEPGEDFARQKAARLSTRRFLLQLLEHGREWRSVLLTSLLLQIFALVVPMLTGALVDQVLPRSDRELLTLLAIGLGAIVVFNFIGTHIRAQLLTVLRTRLDTRMTVGFLEHLVALPYEFFQRHTAGDLLMRLGSNQVIRERLTTGALSGILNGGLATLYLVLLLVFSPPMAAVAIGAAALELGAFFLTRRPMLDLLSQGLATQAKSEAYQVELMIGIETLKGMGAEQRAIERWTHLFVDSVNVWLRRARLSAGIESVTSSVRLAAPIAILLVGASLVLDGQMSIGTLLALSGVAIGFLGPFSGMITALTDLQFLVSYIERVDDVLQTPREREVTSLPRAPKLVGKIELADVSFRYGPHSPLVLKRVSLSIEPGQFVAIVGRSGSGKSTLANLMLGLYEPVEGRIAFDGLDLKQLDLTSVRRQLGIVNQATQLFNGTIRNNIALANPGLPLKEIVAAAQTAQVHEEISSMGMGYDTLLIEAGKSLSGGQRQRLAIARALVNSPAILLLDEATSSLDSIVEREIHAALAALKCTRVVIAHRLSTIVDADTIVVVDAGEIVEVGSHRELVQRDGLYSRLVAAQVSLPTAASAAASAQS